MGYSIKVKCKKCNYELQAALGIGFLFTSIYQENMKRMKDGELGEEAMTFFVEHPNGVIDSETVVARCTKCGNYDCVEDFTMYIPKEGIEVPEEVDYKMVDDIKKSYVKYMDYPHKCSSCGGRSKVYRSFARKAETGTLKCPRCDGLMQENPSEMIMWD